MSASLTSIGGIAFRDRLRALALAAAERPAQVPRARSSTSSVGGLVATPGLSACQASRHGVIGLTKVAAIECAKQNIRVNAICPTRSDMFDRWVANPAVNAQVLAAHPIGRFSDPVEQAEAPLFLLSDAASFVTGVALPVDGGRAVTAGRMSRLAVLAARRATSNLRDLDIAARTERTGREPPGMPSVAGGRTAARGRTIAASG